MRGLESSAKSWRAGWIWFVRCGPHVRPPLTRTAPGYLLTERMQFFRTEAIMRGTSQKTGIWRLSLEQIEATVADHLGRGRVLGNQRAPCFSRQISMYLAKNVGGWSATRIGRFYNGRHHTTVLYAIRKIERLRKTDESVDAVIEVLTAVLSPKMECRFIERFEPGWSTGLIEAVATRVLERIARGFQEMKETHLSVDGSARRGIAQCCLEQGFQVGTDTGKSNAAR